MTDAALPPALLRRIGAALYGEPWQARLARELDVADRTMRRWLSGEMPVPGGVVNQLYAMALQRGGELADILDEMAGGNR